MFEHTSIAFEIQWFNWSNRRGLPLNPMRIGYQSFGTAVWRRQPHQAPPNSGTAAGRYHRTRARSVLGVARDVLSSNCQHFARPKSSRALLELDVSQDFLVTCSSVLTFLKESHSIATSGWEGVHLRQSFYILHMKSKIFRFANNEPRRKFYI